MKNKIRYFGSGIVSIPNDPTVKSLVIDFISKPEINNVSVCIVKHPDCLNLTLGGNKSGLLYDFLISKVGNSEVEKVEQEKSFIDKIKKKINW